MGVLQANDYWLRFEYQHRGSPHVHVVRFHNAPDVQNVLASDDHLAEQDLIR